MKSHLGKLVLALAAITVATVTVTDASADNAAAASGAASASFSALPTGTVPLPPKAKPPASIGANEKVPGFFMAVRKGRSEYVQLVSNAKLAKQIADGTGSRGDTSFAGEACFTEDRPSMRGRGGDESETTWLLNLQQTLSMNSSAQRGQRAAVSAVHSERIAEDSGKVSLEVVDAWVDPVTRGVRQIAKSSVPLELVSTLFGGTKVYAAREGQNIHVVMVSSKDKKRTTASEGLSAIADNSAFTSACEHIRAVLKTEKGQGQTASFISTIELPSTEPKEPEVKPEAKNDLGFGVGFRPEKRAEVRVRPIHVHASVTWSSREKEPLLSVSAGWDSRERTAIVF